MAKEKILNIQTGEVTETTYTPIKTSDEDLLTQLRIERNLRLAETDHFGFSDVTMTDAMTTYRQALRDITESYSSLDDVVWPTKPEG